MRRILSFGAGQDFIDDCEGFLTRNGFGLEAYKGKARTGAVGDGAPILLVFDGSLRKDDEAGLDAMLSMDRRLPVVLVSDGPPGTPQSSQVKARYVLQRGFRKKDLLAAARGCAEVLELMERAERLGNELKLRNSELSYVLDIGRTLASSFDLPKVLPKIMDPLRQMVSAEAWSVMLMSNDETELVLEAAKARPGKRVKQFRLKLGQGVAGMAALDRAPKVVPDVARYGDFDASLDAATGWKTRSVMAVPIISKGRLLGVMELINKQDPKGFSGSDLELVSRLLGQAAIAIEQAEMYRKMADLVITDDLTKLFNLRYLERTLEVEVERSMRVLDGGVVVFDGKEGVEPPGSTAGLRGRKWSLYEGGIRESLIVRQTGRVPAGRVDKTSVISALDFFPTFCRMTGVTPPAVKFDGEDVSEAFLGHTREHRNDLFWEYGRDETYPYPGKKWDRSPNCAIRSGNWKALVNADGTGLELYDLSRDEGERENRAGAEPRRARELSQRLLAWRRSLPVLKPAV